MTAPKDVTPYGAIAYRLDAIASRLNGLRLPPHGEGEDPVDEVVAEIEAVVDDLVGLNLASRVGQIITTPDEFAALPYGTVLWDDTAYDLRTALHQVDGIGYDNEPPLVIWDRRDRWHAFDEAFPLRIIYIPESDNE